MNYLAITNADVNNGSGCRVTLWVAGCPHHCLGCHNPESWDFNVGNEFTVKQWLEIQDLCSKDYIEGLTLCGGEPLAPNNVESLTRFVQFLKANPNSLFNKSKNIWCYTGYIWENLTKEQLELIKYIDILVDGPYVESLRDLTLAFRGSSNQRIIDVQKSLKDNSIVELKL